MANEDLTHGAAPDHPPVARAEIPVSGHAAELKFVLPFRRSRFDWRCRIGGYMLRWPFRRTFFFGVSTLGLNPHVQAALMGAFSLNGNSYLRQDRKRHHNNVPAILGAVATAALIITLYVQYSGGVETLAYLLLLVTTLLNRTIFLSVLNQATQHQAQEIKHQNQRLELKVESQTHEIDALATASSNFCRHRWQISWIRGQRQTARDASPLHHLIICDSRDFTTISEHFEPEEVIAILQDYHQRIGSLITQHLGTIGYRAGDGLMAFFNDPVTCEAPVLEAVKLALDTRGAFEDIRLPWSKQGHTIGLGIGIASGYATLGLIGFQGRTDYTAIGGVVNIASRLCDKALDGQVLDEVMRGQRGGGGRSSRWRQVEPLPVVA